MGRAVVAMNSLTRPALLTAKAVLESIALIQAQFRAGHDFSARQMLKKLADQAPYDIAVMDSAVALLDEATRIVARSELDRLPACPFPANDLQDPPPSIA